MKKLLGFLAVAPLTMTSCMIAGSPDGWDEIENDVEDVSSDEVQALLDTVDDHTTTLGTHITSRSQHQDILDIVEYTNYYNNNYNLEDLIALPDGVSLTDLKDSSVTDLVVTSHGGPVFKAIPNYFEAGHRITYIGTSSDELHGKGAPDAHGNPAYGYDWDRTIYIDANKTWNELGIPATSGVAGTDKPVAGTSYKAWFTNDKSGNFAPVGYKASHYNVAAVQAHQLHYDEFREETSKGLMTNEKTTEFNLRTIAILDAVASKLDSQYKDKDLHFLSHSLGAVMSTLYLSTHGFLDENMDDREFKFETFVTAAGRIKFEEEVATVFSQGIGGQFLDHNDDGNKVFTAFTEEQMNAGLAEDYLDDKEDYDKLSSTEQAAHDLLRESYVGGMTEDEYINNLRSGMMLQGHYGSLDNGDIMKTYGGAEKYAYFAHAGYDSATGPLRQDERDVIAANWAGESYSSYGSHGVEQLFDFTADNNLWDIFKPTTAHVELA